MFNPNDLKSIASAVTQAFSKERNRPRERTPNPAQYNKGKYPMRNVQEFPGGHRITVDSTPGYRVMERVHGSGTLEQWSEDGSETKIVVGNVQQHIKEGYTLTVDQNGDIRINGHARVSVGGGAHVEIRGDATIMCEGTWTQYVGGNYNLIVQGHLSMSSDGSHYVATRANREVTVKGNETQKITGFKSREIGGRSYEKSDGAMTKIAPRIDLNP